jgi:hypothetical protein
MTTTRMLPLAGVSQVGNIGCGSGEPIQRSYSATGGGFIDAVGDPSSGDAAALTSQGFIKVAQSGPTSARPVFSVGQNPGFQFLDTTLGFIVIWDGSAFRNPVNGNSV